jgi:hypothetical protein
MTSMSRFDPAEEARDKGKRASKHYREGRRNDRMSEKCRSAARACRWLAERDDMKAKRGEFLAEAATWDELAEDYTKWAEQARAHARFYKDLARRYRAMESA